MPAAAEPASPRIRGIIRNFRSQKLSYRVTSQMPLYMKGVEELPLGKGPQNQKGKYCGISSGGDR